MAARYPDIIDTHAHISSPEFDLDRGEVVSRAGSAGVGFVEVGYDVDSSRKSVEMAETFALACAVGIHPHNAADYAKDLVGAWKAIESLAKGSAAKGDGSFVTGQGSGRIVAIGEIGLDYYRDLSPRRVQSQCLEMGLDLAKAASLPVIIHERDARDDTLGILRNSGVRPPIIFHCFGGDLAFARRCLDLGGYLGLGGVVTYPKNTELRDLLRFIPTHHILLETDAPYLAPQRRRGRRNEPVYVLETMEAIASSLGLDPSFIGRATRDNALTAFGLGAK